jgi:phenylpropionate dioxygenase-like ring-hydroxylating dioxygenase large terminal subunit
MESDPLATTLRELRRGWIPAHVYSDAAVFEQERKRLFGRTWQFLAHESEVPNVGDYVVRQLLDDSFIVIRGDDGKVRALLNMCRHRGMQICRAEQGNAKRLTCPYHMWSYRTDGRLFGVPFHDEAYGGNAGLPREEMSLIAPATELFNGMVFINLDDNAPPLREYLGDFATYLSFYTAPSPAGVEVRGPQRWRFKGNWKISSENFAGDSYHTPHTHASMAEIGVMSGARGGSRKGGAVYYAGHGAGATFKLGDGNFEERLASIGYPEAMIRARAETWPEAVRQIIGKDGFVPSASTLFPNLSMLHLWAKIDDAGTLAPFTTIRLWQPVSPEETETLSWFVVDKSATDEFKAASYKAYLMCFGSTGMFEQDDMENWSLVTRMSRGEMGRRVHLHNRMGLAEDGSPIAAALDDFSGPGVAHVGFSEHNQRRWMEMWSSYMAQDTPAPTPLGVPHQGMAAKEGQ